MDSKLASGDNGSSAASPRYVETVQSQQAEANLFSNESDDTKQYLAGEQNVTPQTIEENEINLKERIAHCKNIVESLKLQISEEKEKLKTESKMQAFDSTKYASGYHHDSTNFDNLGNSSIYSACVDRKLHCDESLIEYEKQLEKYQNTLNMAQNEKKNAIRKQMLAKAFRLKLMEIENQCNIELLRVKQSLQCLEPLQMIVNKWNTEPEESLYDINNFELMPTFLELKAHSGCDVNSLKGEFDMKLAQEPCNSSKDDSVLLDRL